MLRTILILGRVSNLPTVGTNVLAGWFLAGGGWTAELVWLVAGVALLYVAGMTLNDAFDADWDREHVPERPIPSGVLSRRAVWLLGWGQLAAGFAVLIGMTGANLVWAVALAGAILLYDWIHKRTPWSVLVMGGCRALVYPLAASAAASHGTVEWYLIWAVAGAMGIYVVGITLAARSERTGDGGKKEFGILTKMCLSAPIVTLALAPGQMEEKWLRLTLFFGSILVVFFWMTVSEQLLRTRTRQGVAFAIAGITLIDAAAVVYGNWVAGLLCLALFPLTLALQRKVPAT